MNYPTYESYKPSNIEWVGDIPSHWNTCRISYLFKRTKEIKYPDAELLSVYRDYGVIPKNERDDNYNKPSEDLSKYQLVRVGDLVLNKMKTWQGSIAISKYEGIVSPAYYVARPIADFDLTYMHYLLRSKPYIAHYHSLSGGIRPNQWDLDYEKFRSIEALIPPIFEQKAISNFLDYKIAKIDEFIAKQRNMIELLQEYRQAIIIQAVTKGLNPNVPMKDSGIEWIGKVPAHWKIRKVSHIFNMIGSGTTPKTEILEYYDGDVPWVITGDLNDSYLTDTGKKITDLALRDHSALKIYSKGTLLIAMYGATIGKISILDIPATTNQACCALSHPINMKVKYVYYWFLGNRGHIISLAYGGGQPNISQEVIKNLRIPCPSIDEQKEIIEYLDKRTKSIDALINQIQHQTELLQEYRQALITEAVTGKIDVRSFQKEVAQ